jgi:cytochrome c
MHPVKKWFGICCFTGGITFAVAANFAINEFLPKFAATAQARPTPTTKAVAPAASFRPDNGPLIVAAAGTAKTPSNVIRIADAKTGERQFKKCKACHTIEKGGKNKVGPNLWGVAGRDIASVNGFKYSKALKAKDGAWTLEFLDVYLKSPRKAVKGTRMSFAGIKKDAERAALIAFLQTQSDESSMRAKELPTRPTDTKPTNTTVRTKPAPASIDTEKVAKLTKLRERGRKYVMKDLKLPGGLGMDETEAYCSACHSMRLVVQQGQTRDGWDELLEYMVEEHAMEPLPADDRKLVLDYLSKNYDAKRRKAKRRP